MICKDVFEIKEIKPALQIASIFGFRRDRQHITTNTTGFKKTALNLRYVMQI